MLRTCWKEWVGREQRIYRSRRRSAADCDENFNLFLANQRFCVAAGELIGTLGNTEPGHGSDAAGIETTARKEGDEYVIDCIMTFMTHGTIADYVLTMCRTGGEGTAASPRSSSRAAGSGRAARLDVTTNDPIRRH